MKIWTISYRLLMKDTHARAHLDNIYLSVNVAIYALYFQLSREDQGFKLRLGVEVSTGRRLLPHTFL